MAFDRRVFKGSIFLLAALLISLFFHLPSLTCFILILFIYHLSFFRDPSPAAGEAHQILSPASGTVVDITEVTENRFLNQEAVRIGIFLSLFDAHVNRSPVTGKIEYMKYEPGKFFNALKEEASRENESVWIGIQKDVQKILVRPISGAIARRICSDVKEKEHVTQGGKLGIICYGSRTELFVPKSAFKVNAQVGQKVHVGRTVLGEWTS